jgi:adenylate kinase family enzyme
MQKALLLFGPSGVGKSTVSKWLAEDLALLCYNADGSQENDIDRQGLRSEWDDYWNNGQPKRLYEILIEKAKAHQRIGTVLSLPSLAPNFQVLEASEQIQLKSVVLFASINECIGSFLIREWNWQSGLDGAINHWKDYNINNGSYNEMKQEKYNPFRVLTMVNGKRRDRAIVVSEIRAILDP